MEGTRFLRVLFFFQEKIKKQLTDKIIFAIIVLFMQGEVSERFKELVLKTSDSKEPRVRIPISPPFFKVNNLYFKLQFGVVPGLVTGYKFERVLWTMKR